MRWRSRGGRLWNGALYAAAGAALVFLQAATAAPNSTNSTGQSTGTATTTPAQTTSTPTNTTTTSSVGAAACGVTKFTHKGGGFQNATFTMALHAEPPFVYYNPGAENAEDVYSGFTVEVARLLEIELACKFDFILGDEAEPEPAAGALAAIGSASGGAKARGDVAGGALHISVVPPPNSTRALHFSMPFYDSGYVMIIRAPILESNPWSFFSPFDYSLWLAVLVEMMLVAVACWLMEAPVCSIFRDTDVVDGFFHGLMDSMYWSITLLLQTPDKAPRTWGGKMVLVAHGWFMLIIIASYTANLASFLTAAEPVPILDSWQDVLKSNGRFKVAVPRGLSHENFVEVERLHFKEANNGLDPNLNIEWVSTWQEAFEHVRNGTVDATFHDEPVAQDYIIRMGWQCELLEVGKIFNSFGYGFAFSYDNTNFVAFSQAIVYLKERGYIDDLLRRFQIGPIDSGASESCSVAASEDDPMTWYELQGLSVMVGAFILVGFVVNVVERLSFGRRIFTCLPKEDEERKGSEADVNSKFGATRFSRRHASQVFSEVAADQSEEDRQALASALRSGVRAGVVEAIVRVARENEGARAGEGLANSSNPQYKKQVAAMLEKAEHEEGRIERWKKLVTGGTSRGEKELLGKGGALSLEDSQLAEVHRTLAEWL